MRKGFICAAAVMVLVSGCTSSSDKPDRSEIEAGLTKDVTTWAMPLDEYGFSQTDSFLQDAADRALTEDCMAALGQPLPPMPGTPSTRTATMSEWGERLFSPATAATWGYHEAPWRADAATEAAYHTAMNTASQQPGFADCMSSSSAKIRPANKSRSEVSTDQIKAEAFEAAVTSPEATAAAATWHACMAPLGLADLPDTPRKMPPTSFFDPNASPPTPITDREITVAKADAACRESSGWTTTVYNRQWDAELDALVNHYKDFQQLKDWATATMTVILRTLQEHGITPTAG